MKKTVQFIVLFLLLSIGNLFGQDTYKIRYEIPYNHTVNHRCPDYSVKVKFSGDRDFTWVGGGWWPSGRNTLRGEITVPANKRITQFEFYSKRHHNRRCKRGSRHRRTLTVNVSHKSCGRYNLDVSFLAGGNALGGASRARIYIEPNVRLRHTDGTPAWRTKNVCVTGNVSFSARNGYGLPYTDNSIYRLQYRVPGAGWRRYYGSSGRSRINLKYTDLFREGTTAYRNNINKPIQFRIDPNCYNSPNSNTLTVRFLPEPPRRSRPPTYTQPQCSVDGVNDLTFYFNRQLFTGERMNFNLKRWFGGSYNPVDSNDNIRTLTRVSNGVYKYTWSGNIATAGNYRIELSGSSGVPYCNNGTLRYDFTVNIPPPVVFNDAVKVQDETCYNVKDGKIDISASGGSGNFNYSLDDGYTWSTTSFASPSTSVSGLAPGTYKVRIRDTKNCEDINKGNVTITINAKAKIEHTILATDIVSPSAPSNADASVRINNVTGGTPISNYYDYTLLINGSTTNIKQGRAYQSGFTILDLPAGIHKIRYTDDNNCTQEYILPEIRDPEPVKFTLSKTEPNCFEGTGKIKISNITGGYADYEVIVEKSGTSPQVFPNVSTSGIEIDVIEGTYTVTVKDTRSGKFEEDITLTAPREIEISNIEHSEIKCNGANTTITLTVIGGASGVYQYAIFKPSGIVWEDSNVFTLAANPIVGYRFIARDKNIITCKSNVSSVVKINEPEEISIGTPQVVHNNIFGDNKGSIKLTINGGTPIYTVSWKKLGDASFSKDGLEINQLKAGIYVGTITDANDCKLETSEIVVQEPEKLIATITEIQPIKCKGGKGTLQVNPSGGSGSYSYQWYKNGSIISGATQETLEDVSSNYTVTVNDGFTTATSAIKNVIEPNNIDLKLDKIDITCNTIDDGKIKLTVNGGTPPYSFSIDNKTTFESLSTLTDNTIEGLTDGSYNVWIKDNNDCIISSPKSITIDRPTLLEVINSVIVNNQIKGESKGKISLDVTGGTSGYSYEWTSNNDPTFKKNTKDITDLPAAIYTIVITDNNGCKLTKDYEVKEPLELKVTIKQTKQILCNGDETAILVAEVVGGYPINSTPADFDYKWYNITNGTPVSLNTDLKLNSKDNLGAGTYRVIVNDAKGVSAQGELTISEPLAIGIDSTIKNISCFGETDGSIDVKVSGGVAPYTFIWKSKNDPSYNETSEDIKDLAIGNYFVEVIDDNGCKFTSNEFIITQPNAKLEVSKFEIKNLTGYETDDGSISVDITGGTPNYTYEWRLKRNTTIIGTTNLLKDIKAGAYELTVKDVNLCSTIADYEVTQPDELIIDVINQLGTVLCNGDKNINLTASVKGGVAPYTYSWILKGNVTELSKSEKLDGIGAGIYVLKVIDKNGNVATKEHTITEPLLLEISSINSGNVSCDKGNDGFIDVLVTGGTPPYTYSWKHSATTSSLTSLEAGEYEVTVRDRNLCEITEKIIITQPTPIQIDKFTVKDVTGNGLSNGEISIDVLGGTPNYTYEWKDTNGVIQPSTTSVLSAVKAGVYTVKITDTKDCSIGATYTIVEPLLLTVAINEISILCKDGIANLTADVKGGVVPYTYSWILKGDTTELSNSSKLDAKAGIYILKITDNNGNVVTKEHTVSEPLLLEVASVDKGDASCYRGDDGFIELSVVGGVAPYTYNWSHTSSDTNRLDNLTAGMYSVSIADNNGCIINTDVKIQEPTEYDITRVKLVRPTSNMIDDGSIEIFITGGIAPYTYEWKDETGNIVANSSSNNLSDKIQNLAEGKYTITVTDTGGCIINEAYNLASPGELLVSIIQIQEIKCHNASNAILDVVTVGGVGGNNYEWYNAATNQLISTTKQLKDIPAGSYYVIVSNAEGIEEQSAVFNVEEPDEIKLTIAEIPLNCFEANDGSFEVEIEGGNSTYEFRYRAQSGFSAWEKVTGNRIKVNNLERNTYTLQVKDTNNCLALNNSGTPDFEITITEPPILVVEKESLTNPSGFNLANGSISIDVVGGTTPYNYEWFNETGTLIPGNSNSVSGLKAGNYRVIVIDANNCSLTKDFSLTAPPRLEVTIVQQSVISCNGADDGKLKANVKGGVPGYTYAWYKEGSTTVLSTSSIVEGLGDGVYYVDVIDANSNTVTSSLHTFKEPAILELTLNSQYENCGTGNDWTLSATITGGTAPYTYLWSTGSNETTIDNLISDSYELTIVDANGCKTSSNISLTPPPVLVITNENLVNPKCFEGNDGNISIDVSGGTPPYTYEWSNGIISKDVNDLSAGVHEVVITDSKGCQIAQSYTIENPEKLKLDLGKDVTLCEGQNYILDASIDNGVNYSWTSSNGFTSGERVIEVKEEGIYTVIVTNTDGCMVEDQIEIKRSSQEVSSDFFVSTIAFVNEPFVAVNVSDHVPDEIEWMLPANAIIKDKTSEYVELYFDTEGEYEITFYSKKGNCEFFTTKKVIVTHAEVDSNNQGDNASSKPMIRDFVIYPNPSSGVFSIDLKLREKNNVSVKIYSLLSNGMIDYKKVADEEEYKINYNLNLVPGLYFVLLETENEKLVKKIIIR